MTNNNNNGTNSSNDVVLVRFEGEGARKIIVELEAGHSFRFTADEDEDGNPVVEVIKSD